MSTEILIRVPAHLKPLAEAFGNLVAAVEADRETGMRGKCVPYAQIERKYADLAAAVEREAHGSTLASFDVEAEQVRIRGQMYSSVGRFEARFMTLAGPVSVVRTLYRAVGERNGKTVDPIALRIGAVADHWLPQTATAMSHLMQQITSREAEKSARQTGRLPYSRSSFENVAHEVGAMYVHHHAEVEDALIEEFRIPDEARAISVSIDRISIPMEEPLPRPVGRPRKDAPKRPIERAFRMGYCGTVALHNAQGETLHTIRYGRMPQGDPIELAEGLASDVQSLLAQRPEMIVGWLADGAPEMRNLLSKHICRKRLGTRVEELLDFYHLAEKLAPAADLLSPGNKNQRLAPWKSMVLKSATAPQQILDELKESGLEDVVVGTIRPVHDAITYVTNNLQRMNYKRAKRLGLPIGSGIVESTCKSLVEVRMKRSGSRWKEDTGEHILQLRALALSDRWDRALDLTLANLRTPVRRVA